MIAIVYLLDYSLTTDDWVLYVSSYIVSTVAFQQASYLIILSSFTLTVLHLSDTKRAKVYKQMCPHLEKNDNGKITVYA